LNFYRDKRGICLLKQEDEDVVGWLFSNLLACGCQWGDSTRLSL